MFISKYPSFEIPLSVCFETWLKALFSTPARLSYRSSNDVGNRTGSTVGVGVALGEGAGEGAGDGEVDGVGVGVGVAVGVTFGTGIKLPLFQISFAPDFMQVYFIPFKTEVLPSFEQALPGFTAAYAVELIATDKEIAIAM